MTTLVEMASAELQWQIVRKYNRFLTRNAVGDRKYFSTVGKRKRRKRKRGVAANRVAFQDGSAQWLWIQRRKKEDVKSHMFLSSLSPSLLSPR
jgi:hypothetical protein